MNSKGENSVVDWKFDADRLEYSVEALALSVQFALQKAMNGNCITQKELASRLGISPARVSQYLSKDAANLTLKTISRIADALGEEFELFSLSDINEMKLRARSGGSDRFAGMVTISRFPKRVPWKDNSAANDQFNSTDFVRDFTLAAGR